MSSYPKKPFGKSFVGERSTNWRDNSSVGGESYASSNSGSGFKKTYTANNNNNSNSAGGDGWTHIGSSHREKPAHKTSAIGGAGYAHRPASDKPHKPNFFKVTKIVDDIMSTSGDLKTIERRLTEYIKSRPAQEEKAKILESLMSYALHELIDCDFISDLIEQMSVHCTTSPLKKDVCAKDGYDVFNWAVWPRYGKNPILNIPRSDSDIITTVRKLIVRGLSPFKVNVKGESIFVTMSVAIHKGLIKPETARIISTMILNISDTDFIMKILRPNFATIFSSADKAQIEKAVILWGITRPGVMEEMATNFFERDLDYCSSVEINRPDASLYMTANTVSFLKIMQEGPKTDDFAEYFATNKITSKMISDFASSIINKFFGVIHRIQECTIDGVYDPTSDKILYKTLHSFGGIIGELSKFVPGFTLSPEQLGKMCTKMKIGYAMAKATNTPFYKEFLDGLYNDPTTRITQKIEIENLRTRLGMLDGAPAKPVTTASKAVTTASKPVTTVSKPMVSTTKFKTATSFAVLDSWEDALESDEEDESSAESAPVAVNPFSGKVSINLSKVKPTETVEVRDGSMYPPVVEDTVYSISNLAKSHDKSTHAQLVYEILLIASDSLSHDSQINGFVVMMNHLHNKSVIDKSLFASVLAEKESEIRDMSDNPRISKFMTIVKGSF